MVGPTQLLARSAHPSFLSPSLPRSRIVVTIVVGPTQTYLARHSILLPFLLLNLQNEACMSVVNGTEHPHINNFTSDLCSFEEAGELFHLKSLVLLS